MACHRPSYQTQSKAFLKSMKTCDENCAVAVFDQRSYDKNIALPFFFSNESPFVPLLKFLMSSF